MIHMVFTTEEFFEEAIEGWPEGDLNPRPMKCLIENFIFVQCIMWFHELIHLIFFIGVKTKFLC